MFEGYRLVIEHSHGTGVVFVAYLPRISMVVLLWKKPSG
jgi:hypothetical protein